MTCSEDCNFQLLSRSSSVSTVTRSWAGRPGFKSRKGLGFSVLATASRSTLGSTDPPIQWVLSVISAGVKRPEHEADHSSQLSAEVKNAWSFTSTPPLRLQGLVLN
jgi:hypothetical protein